MTKILTEINISLNRINLSLDAMEQKLNALETSIKNLEIMLNKAFPEAQILSEPTTQITHE
jgi:hypothetical protein